MPFQDVGSADWAFFQANLELEPVAASLMVWVAAEVITRLA